MRGFSRAIIYHLNEDTMQSTIVWEYQGQDETDQWFNLSLGDADQLENGNILITAGNGVQQSPSRFIEVTPAGEKVWQCWLYTQPETAISSFQADRIPALATPL